MNKIKIDITTIKTEIEKSLKQDRLETANKHKDLERMKTKEKIEVRIDLTRFCN